MPDQAVLDKLVADANAYCLAVFGPFQDAAPTGTFSGLLDKGFPPDVILGWFKDYWNEIKGLGYTPYAINVQMHDGNASCEKYLVGRSQGVVYGSPVEFTAADRDRQIKVLLAQKAAAERDIATGVLKREDTNLDAILAKLHALGWTEPAAAAAAAPAPAEPSLLEATVLRIGRQVFGLDIKTLEELATKIGVIVPPVR